MTVTANDPIPTVTDESASPATCVDDTIASPASAAEIAAHKGAVAFLNTLPFKPVTRQQVRGAINDLPPIESMDTHYYALPHRDLEAALLPAPLHGTGLLEQLTEGYQFGQYVGAPDQGPLGVVMQLTRCGEGLSHHPNLDSILISTASIEGTSYVPASLLQAIGVTPQALSWADAMRHDAAKSNAPVR